MTFILAVGGAWLWIKTKGDDCSSGIAITTGVHAILDLPNSLLLLWSIPSDPRIVCSKHLKSDQTIIRHVLKPSIGPYEPTSYQPKILKPSPENNILITTVHIY